MEDIEPTSKGMLWTGRIITILVVLFLALDAGMKIIEEVHSMEGSTKLGWPANTVQATGIVLMVCTILYAIPRTAVLGALLVTAYLGGATAIMIRADELYYFPVIFGVMVWAGLYFRNAKIRSVLPFDRQVL